MRAVLLALVLSFPGLPSVHAQEPDLVMGEVAVANRSEAVRVQSLPQVLAEAARRLTPDAAPQERVDLAAALEADPLLLHRFEYEQVIRPTSSGIPSIRLMLRGWFHVPRLRSLLVAHGIPVWPGGRVEGTLWLVEEGSEGRGLVDGSQPGLLDSLQAALHPRGVALLPALNDLEDWRMLDGLAPEDGMGEALAKASLRTGADPVVLAWLAADADGVTVQWHVHAGGRDHRLESTGPSRAEALAAGAQPLLDLLAGVFAVRADTVISGSADIERGPGEYAIWLHGLEHAGSYVQAMELLRAQPGVASVAPDQADGDRVRVRVQVTAPLGQLLALLAADGRLRALATPPEDGDLSLQWQP